MEGFSWQKPADESASIDAKAWDDWLTQVREYLQTLLKVDQDVMVANFVKYPKALKDVLERCEYGLGEFQAQNQKALD